MRKNLSNLNLLQGFNTVSHLRSQTLEHIRMLTSHELVLRINIYNNNNNNKKTQTQSQLNPNKSNEGTPYGVSNINIKIKTNHILRLQNCFFFKGENKTHLKSVHKANTILVFKSYKTKSK